METTQTLLFKQRPTTVVHDHHNKPSPPSPPNPAILDTAPLPPQPRGTKRKRPAIPSPQVSAPDIPRSLTDVSPPTISPVLSPILTAHQDIKNTLDTTTYIPNDVPVKPEIRKYHGLMRPSGPALLHPAAPLLLDYATHGCPVDCGTPWTHDEILAALKRGTHPSARQPHAAQELLREVTEKVQQGYARIFKWKDIKHNIPPNLKLSPVAQIPHKSRSYRTILDLSYSLKHNNDRIPSVNTTTTLTAPAQSMAQLGSALTRLIQCMADNHDPTAPFALIKFDIKDGFWRLSVAPDNAWNFAYVLPAPTATPIDELQIVVPTALQMGWCESPPFFGTASETARDVADSLLDTPQSTVHPLEHLVQYQVTPSTPHTSRATDILEVYVDDFFAATNNLHKPHLQHITRALLHGIHSCFPPPSVTGHSGEDPISIKKINNGDGFWTYQKEILGWIVDGANYTIQLSPTKKSKYIKAIKDLLKHPRATPKDLEKVTGKLGHVAIGVPAGKGLLTPLYHAQRGSPNHIDLTPIRQVLLDWIQLLHAVTVTPTDVRELTPALPDYLGYTDASKWGAGGVLWGPNLPNIVWRIEWPTPVRTALNNSIPSEHKLSINDLELAALVLQWLCVEYLCDDLTAAHVGIYSDNTPTVAWATRLAASNSQIATFLLRALALRLRKRQASPLLCASIPGKDNTMADTSSRAFRGTNGNVTFSISDADFLTHFNSRFPLQSASWHRCHLPASWTSQVMSCLLGQPLTMASWNALPKPDKNTGTNGSHILQRLESIPTSEAATTTSNATLSLPRSLQGSGQATSAEDIRSQFKPLLTRFRPSPRPSNWLENPPLSTKRRKLTTSLSKGWWKASDD